MAKLEEKYKCSLQLGIDLIGGKWKMRIIWYLIDGTKRYSELKRKIPDVAQKTLTQQLRELEECDIIKRTIYAEMPPRVEYSLTEQGVQLTEVLKSLSKWSHNYAIEKDIEVSTRVKNQ